MKKGYEKPIVLIELFTGEDIVTFTFSGDVGNSWKPGEETADA